MKVVVFDDDPTGSQTVHGCPLLLRADAVALRQGLQHPSPLLFVLANSRALEPAAARERVAGICRSLGEALRRIASEDARLAARLQPLVLVSRGDSTLRGHFPLELEVIEQELLGGQDAVDGRFLVPAFLPGGAPPSTGSTCSMASRCTPVPLPATACSATAPAIWRPTSKSRAVAGCRRRRCSASPSLTSRPIPRPWWPGWPTCPQGLGGGGCGAAPPPGGVCRCSAGADDACRCGALGAAPAVSVPVGRQPAQRPGGVRTR